MLVLLLFLISRLINQSGFRISHSKVFSSEYIFLGDSVLIYSGVPCPIHNGSLESIALSEMLETSIIFCLTIFNFSIE